MSHCPVPPSLSLVFHKDHPLVCQWFISLARLPPFTSAQWRDSGSTAHLNFILAKTSRAPTDPQPKPTSQTSSKPVSKPGGVREGAKPSAQKRGDSKVKGQGSKVQQKPEKPAQQSVSSQ